MTLFNCGTIDIDGTDLRLEIRAVPNGVLLALGRQGDGFLDLRDAVVMNPEEAAMLGAWIQEIVDDHFPDAEYDFDAD